MASANAKITDYNDFADNVAQWVADKGEPAVAEMLYAADLADPTPYWVAQRATFLSELPLQSFHTF